MSGIPADIKTAIVDSCTKFGTTTLGFSYGFLGLIIAIGLIVLAAYKVISWMLCLVLIIAMAILMAIFVMVYQYVVSNSISNGLDGIKIPDLLDTIMKIINFKPNIPPIPGNLPPIPGNLPRPPPSGNLPGNLPKPQLDAMFPTVGSKPTPTKIQPSKIKELEESIED